MSSARERNLPAGRNPTYPFDQNVETHAVAVPAKASTLKSGRAVRGLMPQNEGPSAGELNDAAPAPIVSKDAATYADEKRFEEQERGIRWAWEDELCKRVRAGEVSIEAAIRAVGLHATIVQLHQDCRTESRRLTQRGSGQ